MYIIKYGDRYLHNPKANLSVLDVTLDAEDNSCGFCDFSLYPGHPLYDVVIERDENNPVVVYEDEEVLFAGYIYQIGEEFNLVKPIKCRGVLDYLNDSIVRPYSTKDNNIGEKAPSTVDGYFQWLIQQHNSQVPAAKQFVVGICEGASLDSNNYIYRENKTFPNTLSEINEKIIQSLGGYIRVRYENDVRYIDLIAKWTDKNTQVIQFGVNLTDYNNSLDTQDIATYIIPVGAKYEETVYDYTDGYFLTEDTVMNPEKTYFTPQYELCENLTQFVEGELYFEYEEEPDAYITEDTAPVKGINYYLYQITGYILTEDTTMKENKEYYTAEYYGISTPETFEEGATYYESFERVFETEDTTPISGISYYIRELVGEDYQYTLTYVTEFDSSVTYYEMEYEFLPTTDVSPVSGKEYYILQYDNFNRVTSLGRFRKYNTYYEYYDETYGPAVQTLIEADKIFNISMTLLFVNVTNFDSKYIYYEQESYYFVTSDTTVDPEKSYYTLKPHEYTEVGELGRFRATELYFEYFEDYDQGKLNIGIKGLTDRAYDNNYVKQGDLIYHAEAVKKYGWIGSVYKNEDIHICENLVDKAIKELEKRLSPIKSIDVKAIDMHFLNEDAKPIRIGEYVRIVSKPHNLDDYFVCTEMSLNLTNPQSSTYTFGSKVATFTGAQVDEQRQISSTKDSVTNLSNNVEYITKVVNNNTTAINKQADSVDIFSRDLNGIKNKIADLTKLLNNEINSRSQLDRDHDRRLGLIESSLAYYIIRTLKMANPLTMYIFNETKSIGSISFAVMFPVTVKVNVDCIFDVETDVNYGDTYDIYDEVQVEVQYIVNGVVSDWKPVETYLDGKHLLSTTYDIYVGTTATQNLEVRLRVSGGTIKIAQGKAKVILSAQSLRYIFTGDINIYDEVPVHGNMIRTNHISDAVEIETKQYQNPDGSDDIYPVRLNKYFKIITDGTEVSTNA